MINQHATLCSVSANHTSVSQPPPGPGLSFCIASAALFHCRLWNCNSKETNVDHLSIFLMIQGGSLGEFVLQLTCSDDDVARTVSMPGLTWEQSSKSFSDAGGRSCHSTVLVVPHNRQGSLVWGQSPSNRHRQAGQPLPLHLAARRCIRFPFENRNLHMMHLPLLYVAQLSMAYYHGGMTQSVWKIWPIRLRPWCAFCFRSAQEGSWRTGYEGLCAIALSTTELCKTDLYKTELYKNERKN